MHNERYVKIYLFALILSNSSILDAQEATSDGEAPSTVQQLLELVKEGQVREQSENSVREAEFLANKNKQASILAAEKRELARQERIADQLKDVLLLLALKSFPSTEKLWPVDIERLEELCRWQR